MAIRFPVTTIIPVQVMTEATWPLTRILTTPMKTPFLPFYREYMASDTGAKQG